VNDVASVITFAFADKFAFERALTAWDFTAGNEDEDIQVFQAFEFFSSIGDPIFMLRRCQSFGP